MVGMSKPYQREGGLAEFISIPEKNIHIVSNDLELKEGAGVTPTSITYHPAEAVEIWGVSKKPEMVSILYLYYCHCCPLLLIVANCC